MRKGFVIGVTGSLSTGKSLVAHEFQRLGARLIDADKIAREQLDPGKPAFKKTVAYFSKDILSDGRINRRELAGIVFKDSKKLKKLEGFIHPYVEKAIKKEIQIARKKNEVLVLDVPLLMEVGWDKFCDLCVVVKTSRAVQMARAVKTLRITPQQASSRIKAQMPLKDKLRCADVVIDNNGTKTITKQKVMMVWKRIVQRIKKS